MRESAETRTPTSNFPSYTPTTDIFCVLDETDTRYSKTSTHVLFPCPVRAPFITTVSPPFVSISFEKPRVVVFRKNTVVISTFISITPTEGSTSGVTYNVTVLFRKPTTSPVSSSVSTTVSRVSVLITTTIWVSSYYCSPLSTHSLFSNMGYTSRDGDYYVSQRPWTVDTSRFPMCGGA